MNEWLLDFDGSIFLDATKSGSNDLTNSPFFKIHLRRFRPESTGDIYRFRFALNYLDFKKIVELCSNECAKRKIRLHIGKSLEEYIGQREMFVEERSRLGLELKRHDPKLNERFGAFSAVVNRLMTRKLRERQLWDSFFLCAMQKSANFSVPGSGKTASVLGTYAYLRSRGDVNRLVVVCPKNAFGSWRDEFAECFNGIEQLREMNIHASAYKNTDDRRRALMYESGSCNLILVNYESVGGVQEALKQLVETNTLLVFDEVHKVKQIGGKYASSALEVAKNAAYVIAMTGTPIPNSYRDVYNLLHILFPIEYDFFFGFTPAFLDKPRQREIDEINAKIQPFFCRTTKAMLNVPPANAESIYRVAASEPENRLLKLLCLRYRDSRLALVVRILQMETNPRRLLKKLDPSEFKFLLDDSDAIENIDYSDYSEDFRSLVDEIGASKKLKRCIQLVADKVDEGKTVIVWCIFIDSMELISKSLREMGIETKCIYGEVPLNDRETILAKFKEKRFQVLLANPHTLAESVSLHTACHDAVYYEYSYNLVHLLQSKDRIHRLGLPAEQYTQYDYLSVKYGTERGGWSLDDEIYDRLKLKESIMLNAIDQERLESMPTSDEDLDRVFAKMFDS